jgi:predicted protein tyrosine phosphatase
MRLLFLCTSNRLRSPTAEGVFRTWPGMAAASAGLDPSATRHVDVSMIEAADMIFVMEARHRTQLQRRFKDALGDRPVIVLGIPDEYERDDPALIELLRERVTPFLPEAGGGA